VAREWLLPPNASPRIVRGPMAMPEELFDIVLIRIGRAGPAGSARNRSSAMKLSMARHWWPGRQSLCGQPTGVAPRPLAQEIFELGWEIEKACQRADLQGPVGDSGSVGAADVGNLAPGQRPSPATLYRPGMPPRCVEERPHNIASDDCTSGRSREMEGHNGVTGSADAVFKWGPSTLASEDGDQRAGCHQRSPDRLSASMRRTARPSWAGAARTGVSSDVLDPRCEPYNECRD